MYLVCGGRSVFTQTLPKGGHLMELGVFKGEHAHELLSVVNPSEFHLVDRWRYDTRGNIPFSDIPKHFENLDPIYRGYFGDDPNARLESCYNSLKDKYAGDRRVHIHRCVTWEAAALFPDGYFDMIYFDANLQYESALRDLLEFAPKLKIGGTFIVCNYYESVQSRLQNLGVIGAVTIFKKYRPEFNYVALTTAPFSNIVLSNNRDSEYCRAFIGNLLESNLDIVNLPDAVVPNYSHDLLELSGKRIRAIPSFS